MIYISISAFIMGFLFAKIVDRNLAKRAKHQAKIERRSEHERTMRNYGN